MEGNLGAPGLGSGFSFFIHATATRQYDRSSWIHLSSRDSLIVRRPNKETTTIEEGLESRRLVKDLHSLGSWTTISKVPCNYFFVDEASCLKEK